MSRCCGSIMLSSIPPGGHVSHVPSTEPPYRLPSATFNQLAHTFHVGSVGRLCERMRGLLPATALEDHAYPLSGNSELRLELGERRAGGSQLADLADLLPGELRAVTFGRHSHSVTSERLFAPFPTAGHGARGRYLR